VYDFIKFAVSPSMDVAHVFTCGTGSP
jgi:hypothetical protein